MAVEGFNIKICEYLFPNLSNLNISNFHQVVGRGSETQLQMGENLNKLT